MSAVDDIRQYLNERSHWNDGAGLIVPPSIAARLKSMGIDGPYTVFKPISK